MDKKTLSIYVNLQDENINIPSYLNDSKFIISICPASVTSTCGKLSHESIKKIEGLLDKGSLLGQRGYKGWCNACNYKRRHKHGIDIWHENLCLYEQPLGLRLQTDLMSKGKRILEKTFGITPEVYAPINHLYDEDTLEAAQQLGYKFVMEQSNTILMPYERQGLIIIPESKIKKPIPKSAGIYSHASELEEKLGQNLPENTELVLPGQLTLKDAPVYKLKLNELHKRAKKYARDLKNMLFS